LVLGHSTDPALWIDSDDQSPFNVADLSVWMEDFGPQELAQLNRLHGDPVANLAELRSTFGGHPYLARLAFYTLVKEGGSVAHVATMAMQPKGPFSGHLRRHLLALQKHPRLADAVRKIVRQAVLGRAGGRDLCPRCRNPLLLVPALFPGQAMT